MKRLKIELYKQLTKADFYSIRFTDKQVCETDAFISRFVHDLLYQEDFSKIVYWLNKIGMEHGALERYFRLEGLARAIPIQKSNLRLYCYRLSDDIIILGNGGIKSSQKIQDSPDAYPAFHMMNVIARKLKKRIGKGVEISGREITGNLEFDIDQ